VSDSGLDHCSGDLLQTSAYPIINTQKDLEVNSSFILSAFIPFSSMGFQSRADLEIISSISGKMTGALSVYSGISMCYSWLSHQKITSFFVMHFVSFNAQLTQGFQWYRHW